VLLHWAPLHDDGLGDENGAHRPMDRAGHVLQPSWSMCSVEVALFVRLLGGAGDRDGRCPENAPTHHMSLVNQLADRIVATLASRYLRAGMAAGTRRQDELCRWHQPFRRTEPVPHPTEGRAPTVLVPNPERVDATF